jgi:hypothetical protein
VDTTGLRVYEVRVGLQVGAQLLLQLAVLEERLRRRVVHLQERPDLRVGEVDAKGAERVRDLLRAVEVQTRAEAF